MKKLIKPEMFKWVIPFFLGALAIKLLWLIVQLVWLTATDLDQPEDRSIKVLHYKVKLTPNQISAPVVVSRKLTKIVGSIKEIKLLAVYSSSHTSVVTIEYKKKTKVLGSGDVVNGFKFESAGNNFAIFSREGKEYKIVLIKNSKAEESMHMIKISKPVPKKIEKMQTKKKILGEVINEGSTKIIDRSLLDHYANDMDDIYKNIGIAEMKKGKDLTGFKINFVKRDSPFAKLGIHRNDVIKSINGQEITSYNAAFSVYKTIKDIDNLSLVIVRDNEEMELEYEIN